VRAVLFDLDRTLLDFDRAQRGALRAALAGFGLSLSPPAFLAYRAINEALWAAYRRGEIRQQALEVERFRQLLARLHADERRAPALSRRFLACLSARGDRLPGCRAILGRLRKRYRLGVVTNGIHRVQHARLRAARLQTFFEVIVTSEACGFAKPDPRILSTALDTLGLEPRQALFVGDDVAVDGGAARAAGVPFCWLDRGDAVPPGHARPRRRIGHLRELGPALL
jgi:2-haloacid dehalogenase